jgi:hypothetical protein
MKHLKITIHKDKNILLYPVNYQEEVGDFAKDHLYYDDELGNTFLILNIEDKDYKPSMIRKDVEEITEAEVIATSEAKEVRTEMVTDEAKIKRLTIKASLGQKFTADELKAIDPNDPTLGINVTPILADRITTLKSVEILKKAEALKVG